MDTKTVPLTDADILRTPDHEILRILAEHASSQERRDYRILDFGCGRGELVGRLRRAGWRAFGAEIEPTYIANAGPVAQMTDDGSPILSLSVGGRTVFPDDHFDAVVSDQVIEHVADIDAYAGETARLLRPGGLVFHRFPARFSLLEPHYRLPIAHWMPEGALRYSWIRMLTLIGFGRTAIRHNTRRGAAEEIYHYSRSRTFYRRRRAIAKAFANHGIEIDFRPAIRKRVENRLKKLGSPPWLSSKVAEATLVADAYSSFVHCVSVGVKRGAPRLASERTCVGADISTCDTLRPETPAREKWRE